MSPSIKSRIKHIIKLIGIYSAVLAAIGGWIYVVADNYYGNKYKNLDIAKEVIILKDKDTNIVTELQKYSDTNFKNNREVINQLVEGSKKNDSDHTIITNKLSRLETTSADSNQRIIRIENILMNKKMIEGEIGLLSE